MNNGRKSALEIGLSHFRAFALIVSFVVLIAIIVITTGWNSIDEKIRSTVESELNRRLAEVNLQATLDRARLVDGKGIEIHGLEIRPKSSLHPAESFQNLVTIKQINLHCSTDLQQLIAGDVRVRGIDVNQATFQCYRDKDGKWNIAELLRALKLDPSAKKRWVPVSFKNASILVVDRLTRKRLEIENIQLKLTPHFSDEQSALPNHIKCSASCAVDGQTPIKLAGHWNPSNQHWNAAMKTENLTLDRQWLNFLVPQAMDEFQRIDSINVKTSFELTANGAGFKTLPQFRLKGKIRDSIVEDKQLVTPITNIDAEYVVTHHGFQVFDGTARTGVGNASFAYEQTGLLERKSWQLFGKFENLNLEPGLRKLLPAKIQAEWDKYSPRGTLDLQFQFWKEQSRVAKKLKAELKNASFEHHDLPFRFASCVGTVKLDDKQFLVDIQSLETDQIITLTGKFDNPGANATGYLDVRLSDRLVISEKVLRGLQKFESAYQVVKDFNMTGQFGFEGRLSRTHPKVPYDFEYVVELFNCSSKYRHFQYPFHQINGRIKYNQGKTTFANITAMNGNGKIRCDGTYDSQNGLDLRFVASQVSLDEQLRRALNARFQEVWSDVRPQGSLAQVVVDLERKPADQYPRIRIQANAFGQGGRPSQLRARPTWFPYEFDSLAGQFIWDSGTLKINHLSGRHGRGWFSCNGTGKFEDDRWRLKLKDVASGSIRVDQPLKMALPATLQKAVNQIQLDGTVGVFGEMEFSGRTRSQERMTQKNGRPYRIKYATRVVASEQTEFKWNLRLDTESAKMNFGLPVEKLNGAILIRGWSNENDFVSSGHIEVDSAVVNGFYVAGLSGPIWMDRHRIAFGSRARRAGSRETPKSITGRLFDGQLSFDGEMRHLENSPFVVNATLTGGDLRSAMAEMTGSNQNNYSGKGYASLTLYGNSTGTHSLRGNGVVRLRESRIEIPVTRKLGEVLPRQLDRTTLDAGNFDFTVHGADLDFSRIELIGNRISLIGNGKMNLNKKVDLNFYTVAGRNRLRIPVLTELLKAGSQQILWVTVSGTLNEPKIKKEVLPALSDSLKLFLRDLDKLQERAGVR